MIVPNKLFPYEESVLSLFPVILTPLEKGPLSPLTLYRSISKAPISINDYLEALDALRALGKIEITDRKEVALIAH